MKERVRSPTTQKAFVSDNNNKTTIKKRGFKYEHISKNCNK